MKHLIYNFCTLFDSYYLPKGLILYDSLCNVCDNFHLYIYAFDDECYQKLTELNLSKISVISLKEFETKELLDIKPTRNRTEYCWTCGPSTIYHTIKHFNSDHCVYIDADLMFFNSPKIAFDEIEKANASVAITEHFIDDKDLVGKFCVQFVYFKNDENGINALTWWRDSCIEWCFARFEDGKYGDQKYLEAFQSKFNNVYIMENRGVGVAPWNMKQYNYKDKDRFSFNGKEYKVVFFHYHGLKTEIKDNKIIIKSMTYDYTKCTENIFLVPFAENFKKICNNYLNIKIDIVNIKKRNMIIRFYSFLKQFLKKYKFVQIFYFSILKKRYNGYEKINLNKKEK